MASEKAGGEITPETESQKAATQSCKKVNGQLVAKLERLSELKKSGALSNAEFEERKRKLIEEV